MPQFTTYCGETWANPNFHHLHFITRPPQSKHGFSIFSMFSYRLKRIGIGQPDFGHSDKLRLKREPVLEKTGSLFWAVSWKLQFIVLFRRAGSWPRRSGNKTCQVGKMGLDADSLSVFSLFFWKYFHSTYRSKIGTGSAGSWPRPTKRCAKLQFLYVTPYYGDVCSVI